MTQLRRKFLAVCPSAHFREPLNHSSREDFGSGAFEFECVVSWTSGLTSPVGNPADAVIHMGVQQTNSVALVARAFSTVLAANLWEHSMLAGKFARWNAEEAGAASGVSGNAIATSLLHDIGQLIFAANPTVRFGECLGLEQKRSIPRWQAERQSFGVEL